MTTVLAFTFAAWCTAAQMTGAWLAGEPPTVARTVMVPGLHGHLAACQFTWDGYHSKLLDWCSALSDTFCLGRVDGND